MPNPLDLSGRTIVVTGASSGIGRETSIVLGELGARLVLAGRQRDELERTAAALPPGDHRIESFELTNLDAIPAWLKGVADAIGPLDDLVHSAGVHFTLPLRATTPQQFSDLMRVNVDAAFALAKGFRQKSVRRAGSSSGVVFLSSVMGLVGQTGISAYSASKGALVSLTKSLALELARENIRVNAVAPRRRAHEDGRRRRAETAGGTVPGHRGAAPARHRHTPRRGVRHRVPARGDGPLDHGHDARGGRGLHGTLTSGRIPA